VERTPEEFHAAARRAVAKGYHALKFDPFGAGFYELELAEKRRVVALVEAVRDAVGPEVEILIEMHGRFNPITAVALARELAPFEPGWLEEPVPPENLKALKKVAEAIAPLGPPGSGYIPLTNIGSCLSCKQPTSSSRTLLTLAAC
jgi:galactonate dehydratase